MAKISGWTFLITGLIVSIASYLINIGTGEFKMFLFFIVGIAFVVIGFFKLVADRKPTKVQRKQPKIVFCPFCGQAVYETQQICHRCRTRLR